MYHININCTNFDRSLEFYKMLGFREVVDMSGGEPAPGGENVIGSKVLRVPDARGGPVVDPGRRQRPALQPYRPDPMGFARIGRLLIPAAQPLRYRARLLL